VKNFLKRNLPAKYHIQKHSQLQIFGEWLHDPNIWHLTRRSSAGGVAVGLFCAFIPFPVQTISAAALAILLRVNLPLSLIFSLVSNPLTIPVMFYLAYKTGAILLDLPVSQEEFQFSLEWLMYTFSTNWQPLLLGCFIFASISSLIGYFSIRLIWRLNLVSKWEARKNNRKNNI